MTEAINQKCTPYPFSTILFLHLCSGIFDKKFQPEVAGEQPDQFRVNDERCKSEQKDEKSQTQQSQKPPLDPAVIKLIDALARAQAKEDHEQLNAAQPGLPAR